MAIELHMKYWYGKQIYVKSLEFISFFNGYPWIALLIVFNKMVLICGIM